MKNSKHSLVTEDIDYGWINVEEIINRTNPVEDFIKRSQNRFENHLKDYLIDNLKRLGYTFHSTDHFIKFCKERVHRVSFKDNRYEIRFYLDYENETETGTYIGAFCNQTSIKHEGSTIIASFGRQLIP